MLFQQFIHPQLKKSAPAVVATAKADPAQIIVDAMRPKESAKDRDARERRHETLHQMLMGKRQEIIREIDGIVANYHGYILLWENRFQALAYWNTFGHPDGYLTRVGDYRDLISLWWIDPDKQRELSRAMADPSANMEAGQTDVRYWQNR